MKDLVFSLCVMMLLVAGAHSARAETPSRVPADLDTLAVLDLRTAGLIAMDDNPGMLAAKARIETAGERFRQARSAYWPRLDLTGSYTRVDLSDTSLATNKAFNPFYENPEDYYKAGLQLTWLLFDGFDRYYTHQSARYGIHMNRESLNDARRLLLSAVANAYYSAQLARENSRIARADKAFYKKLWDEAQSRHKAGTGALSDVLNFEVRYNSSRVDVIRAEKAYEASLYGLAALLGVKEGAFPEALALDQLEPEQPHEMVPVDTNSQIHYAMENRPDIRQQDLTVKIAEVAVNNARSGYYPTLSLIASMEGERSGDSSLSQEDVGNTISLQLSYNLFAGGLTQAKIKESKALKRETLHTKDQLIVTVSRNIRETVTQITSAQNQLTIQRMNTELVRQNRDLVEREYTAGQGSLVRLNEAQRDLTTSRSRLALALVSLRQSLIQLDTDTGRIAETF